MPRFCLLFYANYTILATQRGGNGPPPKYAPDFGLYISWGVTTFVLLLEFLSPRSLHF